MSVPNISCVSEQSRKFYDGTLSISESGLGFTDYSGEYHEFDFSDPAACPPTPLPPTFPDGITEQCQSENHEALYHQYRQGVTVGSHSRSLVSSEEISEDSVDGTKKFSENSVEFTFASDSSDGLPVMVAKNDFFHDQEDQERLISKIGGVLPASRQTDSGMSLGKGYEFHGVPQSERVLNDMNTNADAKKTMWRGSIKEVEVGKARLSSSPLSDYPSDLSEQGLDSKIVKERMTPDNSSLVQTPSKRQPARQPRTRGVAQKVVKTPKKASGKPATLALGESGGSVTKRRTAPRSKAYGNKFIK